MAIVKVNHDLLSLGESYAANNTVAKLIRNEGLKVQIGYKRRLGKYGTKPAFAAANQLRETLTWMPPDTV